MHLVVFNPLAPKLIVLYVFLASALFVHLRGRVRLPFYRQLFNHSTLLAPYNVLAYLFSAVPRKPILQVSDFPALDPLRDNWQVIRDEALQLFDQGHIRAAEKNNDASFNSFFKEGWKRFYLKWYGDELASARALCPNTVALLATIPTVKAAMFASLPPGARLVRHRDPYAGSLRYHLGLITPNSPACYIEVDGQRYHWRDGEAVMFDETYIHHAENTTDQRRVILFCDIERPLHFAPMRWFNRVFARLVMTASATQNVEGEPVGALNRFFYYAYQGRLQAKKLKTSHRRVYYVLKWALIVGALAAIVL